jgi:two-component system, OmpR family, KDP operon response regulator KdpE
MTVILVVDDEPAILRAVRAGLMARGYDVATATGGREAVLKAAELAPDLVVLDLGLADLDGLEVVRRVREWASVPILVLSADGSDQRKVAALDLGADDYVTKPFSMPELLARVRVALRHQASRLPGPDESLLVVGDLRVDVAKHEVTVGPRAVELTPKEFSFLALLARWPGRVLTHRTILEHVWGPEYGSETHYLRVYASNIRRKLADDPDRPRLVAEPGVGYRLLDNTGEDGTLQP